jgi:DNA-binding NarL/FixJ family response regulator
LINKEYGRVMYMIKVFLVEDEVVIRDAIKNSIDWEQEGYEFVGEASDGELAYLSQIFVCRLWMGWS